MKKMLVVFLAIALLLSVGCAKTGPSTEPATTGAAPADTTAPKTEPVATTAAPETEAPAPETEPVQTTEKPEAIDPWSLLGSGGYEVGDYTDELGNEYHYSYDMPVLLADTEGARAINEAIDARFGVMFRNEKENVEKKLSIGIESIGYRGVVWEDILSLVVIAHGNADDWTEYGVYNYDCTEGLWLTTSMVLERMDISEESFLQNCRSYFESSFMEKYSGLSEEERAQMGYDEMLEKQISDEYVNLDLAIYPEDGDVVVVSPILSMAGPEFFYELIPLNLNTNG